MQMGLIHPVAPAGLFCTQFFVCSYDLRVKLPPTAYALGMGLIAAEGGDLWPVALHAGCRPYHRAHPLEGLRGASRLSPPAAQRQADL